VFIVKSDISWEFENWTPVLENVLSIMFEGGNNSVIGGILDINILNDFERKVKFKRILKKE